MQFELFERKKSESIILKEIVELLLSMNYLVIRFNSGVYSSNNRFVRFYTILNNGKSSGLPDLAFMKDGKITFVEVKAPNGRVGVAQNEFIELAQKHNTKVIVTNNWIDLLNIIKVDYEKDKRNN